MVVRPPRLAETVALTSPAASRTALYSGSSTRWNRIDPQTMIGTGRKASRVSCQEVAANTAPTKITVQKVCRMTRAPTSRNRSSWLMSSLITLSTRPGARPLVPGDVELLDVGVRLHPQVVLHRLGQSPPEPGGQIVRGRLDHPDDHVQDRHRHQLAEAALNAEQAGGERVAAADDDVDRDTEEQLRARRRRQCSPSSPPPRRPPAAGTGGDAATGHEEAARHPRKPTRPPSCPTLVAWARGPNSMLLSRPAAARRPPYRAARHRRSVSRADGRHVVSWRYHP